MEDSNVSNEEAKPLEAAGVSQLLEAYESGETNSEQVVSDLFTRIENDALNIFISTPERDALLEQARAQDARRWRRARRARRCPDRHQGQPVPGRHEDHRRFQDPRAVRRTIQRDGGREARGRRRDSRREDQPR